MAEQFSPNPSEHYPMRFEQSPEQAAAYYREFTQSLNAYGQALETNAEDGRRGGATRPELGCALAKARLKHLDCSPDSFQASEFEQQLINLFGSERGARRVLSGFLGELAVMQSAKNYDLEPYLPTTHEDVINGVDLWLDPSGAELEDYAVGDGGYNYIAASIKTSGYIPTEGFPSFISCRTVQEFTDQFDAYQQSFWQFHTDRGASGYDIASNWEQLRQTAVEAAQKLNGQSRITFVGISDIYSNIVPAVMFVPSAYRARHLYSSSGYPQQALVDHIGSGFLSEVGNA